MATDKRQQRRETRLIQKESVWLQKALFALRRAEEMREQIAELRGEEEAEPYTLVVDDDALPMDALEEALHERAQELLETVRERRQGMR